MRCTHQPVDAKPCSAPAHYRGTATTHATGAHSFTIRSYDLCATHAETLFGAFGLYDVRVSRIPGAPALIVANDLGLRVPCQSITTDDSGYLSPSFTADQILVAMDALAELDTTIVPAYADLVADRTGTVYTFPDDLGWVWHIDGAEPAAEVTTTATAFVDRLQALNVAVHELWHAWDALTEDETDTPTAGYPFTDDLETVAYLVGAWLNTTQDAFRVVADRRRKHRTQ